MFANRPTPHIGRRHEATRVIAVRVIAVRVIAVRVIAVLIAAALVLAAVTAPAAGPSAAAQPQTGAPPLLQLLAAVPASAALPPENGYLELSFADYAAADAANPAVPAFAGWAEFNAAQQEGSDALDLWIANRNRINSGYEGFSLFWLSGGERSREWFGFDVFDVTRSLVFGVPPQRSIIAGGAFDPAAIIDAHTARDYTAQEVNGLTVLCGWVGGCEDPNAMDMSPMERDPETLRPADENSLIHNANPFGGDLRRQFPLLPLEHHLLSSQGMPGLEAMAAAYQGEGLSLLDVPEFLAAGEALTQGEDALLVQARFFSPLDTAVLRFDPFRLLAMQDEDIDLSSPEAVQQYMIAVFGLESLDFSDLPPYTLAVMGDRQEGGDQVNVVGLVYPNEASAQTATEVLTARLATLPYQTADGFTLVLDLPGIEAVMDAPAVYYSEAAARYVALAAARYPLPEPVRYDFEGNALAGSDAGGQYRAPGRVYALWYRLYLEGMFTPWVVDAGALSEE